MSRRCMHTYIKGHVCSREDASVSAEKLKAIPFCFLNEGRAAVCPARPGALLSIGPRNDTQHSSSSRGDPLTALHLPTSHANIHKVSLWPENCNTTIQLHFTTHTRKEQQAPVASHRLTSLALNCNPKNAITSRHLF